MSKVKKWPIGAFKNLEKKKKERKIIGKEKICNLTYEIKVKWWYNPRRWWPISLSPTYDNFSDNIYLADVLNTKLY